MSADGQHNYNLEHERAIIGGIKADNLAYDRITLDAQAFYDVRNRTVYQAIETLITSGKEANDLTINDELSRMKSDVKVSYLADIDAVKAGNIEYYVESVSELAMKRRLERLQMNLTEALRTKTVTEIVETLERELTNLSPNGDSAMLWLSEGLPDAVSQIELQYNNRGKLLGISSGYPSLDRLTNGFQGGDLIIIGARPSVGKTALALSMAVNMTCRDGVPVGFFSAEMGATQLIYRILAAESRLNLGQLRSGYIAESDFGKVNEAASRIYGARLLIDPTANISLVKLKARARKMKRLGIKILFVDYLTLIQFGDARTPRYERVGETSKQLKMLARELDVPVVVLSQVRRDAEDRMPNLADLRQSGEIEEDSDAVLFLHRKRGERLTQVAMAKNRNGPTDNFELVFIPKWVRFEEKVKNDGQSELEGE